ncbi:hypothetical protein TWF730_000814 [Orbilia blumenaviensis]|uniref:Uncharacterized protein n=1 Tax=Orbilia blumenaviensis TaxID=1796055 RepID=A0AAV9VPN9_9PEZI
MLCSQRISRALLWSSSLYSILNYKYISGQSVTIETTSTTRTITATEVIFSTTTIVLPWCPCPLSTLATGSIFTSTVVPSSVPSASAVSLQINIAPTDGIDAENLFLNIDGNQAIAAVAPILVYYNDNFQIAEAENLNNLLYLYLGSSVSAPGTRRDLSSANIQRRQDIYGFYPVYWGIPGDDTTTSDFFINDEGKVNLRYQNETGSLLIYEIALCKVGGLLSSQVYMHEVGVAYPSECYAADSFFVTDGEVTSSVTGTGTRTGTRTSAGASTGTDLLSTTKTSGGFTNTGSSSQLITTTQTRTGTTLSSTTKDSSSSSETTSGSTTESGSSTSSGTSTSSGGSAASYASTTVTLYTEAVMPGSSSTTATTNGASVTISLYLPYPSSLKVLAYDNEDIYAGFLNAYLEQFLAPVLGGDAQRTDYRAFVLTSEGWVMNPISGPKITDDVWDGAPLTYLSDPRYIFVAEETTEAGVTYPKLSLDTMAVIASSNGQVLTFEVQEDGTLIPKLSANSTAGNSPWVCAPNAEVLGFTDGTGACRLGKITNIQMRGLQETVTADGTFYDFVPTATTYSETIGVGPTVTVKRIFSKVIITETITITEGDAGYTTVGTESTDATATVTLNQYVVSETTSVWGRTAGDVITTTIGPDALTKTIRTESPYPLSAPVVSIYDYAKHPFKAVLTEPEIGVRLLGYNPDLTELPSNAYESLFTLIDKYLVITHLKKSDPNTWYGTEPHYAVLSPRFRGIYFVTPTKLEAINDGITDAEDKYIYLEWDLFTSTNPVATYVWFDTQWATDTIVYQAAMTNFDLYGCTSVGVGDYLLQMLNRNLDGIGPCVLYGSTGATYESRILYWNMIPGDTLRG